MFFNKKKCVAQGALEYLLMIGAVILILAVVVVVLTSVVVEGDAKQDVKDFNDHFNELRELHKGQGKQPIDSDSQAVIYSFKVSGENGVISGEQITVSLPFGTSLNNLDVEINSIGVVTPSDSKIDFELNSGKIFTVISVDNTNQKEYVVVIDYLPYVDTASPIINLISPENNEKIYGENLTFEFRVFDESQISNCILTFGSNMYKWDNILSGNYQKEIFLTDEGVHDWNVICVDSSNNSSGVISQSFEVIFSHESARVVFLSVGGYGGSIQNDLVQITLPGGTNLNDLPFNVIVNNGSISPADSRMNFSLNTPKYFTLTSIDGTQREFRVVVKYSSETGGEYIKITSCQELQDIDKKLNGKYKLMNHIECGGFSFKPIGGSTGFSGSLEGNGYEIRNLSITNSGFNLTYVGLFGILKGSVKNLRIVNGNMNGYYSPSGGATLGGIAGRQDAGSLIIDSSFNGNLNSKWDTGGIAGESNGTILKSSSSGHFYPGYSSSKSYWLSVGGIVGHQKNGGVVSNCYSSAKIESTAGGSNYTQQAAGLVGRSYGLIEDSYSFGQVMGNCETCDASPNVLRGLVAADHAGNFSGTVSNSYWDVNTSGRITSAGGIGLTTTEMKNSTNFSDWNKMIWSFPSNDYPKLIIPCGDNSCDSSIDENCSTCPRDCGICLPPYNVYNVYSCWNLQSIQNDLVGMHVLMNDINCAQDGVENFTPIGSYGNEFKGFFYGNGYTINNLKIDSSSSSFIGLFGALKGALISGVGLKDADISGDSFVGGIAGFSDTNSIIQYSFVNGKVNGVNSVSGITGTGGTLINCYSNAKIN